MTQEEFDARFCAGLSPQQLDAVHAVDGPVLLLAVPGSGKTTVLILRLGYMVLVRGVAPESILTVTYTTAATSEMKSRFSEKFGRRYSDSMEFCTINSLAVKIIDRYTATHAKRPKFDIASDGEIKQVVLEILGKDYVTDSDITDVKSSITYIKNMLLSESEIKEAGLPADGMDRLYPAYCEKMKARRLMDFDDQLMYARTILRSFPDILDTFRERFRYICVDESQDTSKIQHKIIRLLASERRNIFMVGDEDQSIYGFRAAYPEALLGFENDYPGARVLLMEDNYRSSREITQAAGAFVSRNLFRREKDLRPTREGVVPLNIITVRDRMTQYRYIFELSQRLEGETAVLYRNNDSALPLIDMFSRSGLPYTCRASDFSFFTNRLINDIRSIVLFSSDECNAELFMRIYYKFASPISRAAALAACEASRRSGCGIVDELVRSRELTSYGKDAAIAIAGALPRVAQESAEKALLTIWNELKYGVYAAENRLDEGKFQILLQLARHEQTASGLMRRLDELKEIAAAGSSSPDGPVLSTVHLSKGLEYKNVYFLDAIDGILPALPLSDLESESDRRLYEEDRRVFYVGMTRARDFLSLFSVKGCGTEFVSEVRASLPREAEEPDDLFYSLRGELLGKAYRSSKNGPGRVTAQSGDGRLLIEYENGKAELSDIAALYASRDKAVRFASDDEPSPAGVCRSIEPGTAVAHRFFGRGVVTAFSDGVAVIDFGGMTGLKRISLEYALERGIIRIAGQEPDFDG